jgi:hypothetical protein
MAHHHVQNPYQNQIYAFFFQELVVVQVKVDDVFIPIIIANVNFNDLILTLIPVHIIIIHVNILIILILNLNLVLSFIPIL